MANEDTQPRPASSVVSELADLFAKGAQIYPTLMQAGVTYWAKWLELGIGYYGTTARQWARAVQEPERRPELVQEILDDFKMHLLSMAQVPGEAVLSFNQKVEELLRDSVAEQAAASPEQALRQRLSANLKRAAESPALKKAAADAKLAVPDPAQLAGALARLSQAQNEVQERRLEVHVAAEAAIQAAHRLEQGLGSQADTPLEILKSLVADLERLNALVSPKSAGSTSASTA